MSNSTKKSNVSNVVNTMTGGSNMGILINKLDLAVALSDLRVTGVELDKAALYGLAGVASMQDDEGNNFYPGFQTSNKEVLEKKEKETTLGKAKAYLELYPQEFPKELNLSEIEDELAVLLHDQRLDDQEGVQGYSYSKGDTVLKVQEKLPTKKGQEPRWRNLFSIDLPDADSSEEHLDLMTKEAVFIMKGNRAITGINAENLDTLLAGYGIEENLLVKDCRETELGSAVHGGYKYLHEVPCVDSNGFPSSEMVSSEVRVIISAPNTSRMEDSEGNDIGTKEYFNYEIDTFKASPLEKEVSINKLYNANEYQSVIKALKEGLISKETKKVEEVVSGYSVVPTSGHKNASSPVCSWIKIEEHTVDTPDAIETHLSVTVTREGQLFTPVTILPNYTKRVIVTSEVANTVRFFTAKTDNDKDRALNAWLENLATVDSNRNILVSRGKSEISDESIVKSEDNNLIAVGRALTHAPAHYAVYDQAWAERQAEIQDEKISKFFNKKATAGRKGKEKNIALYYDKLLADNQNLVNLLGDINSTDDETLVSYFKRKGTDLNLLLKVAAAYKRKNNLAKGPLNGDKYSLIRNLAKVKIPSKLTKAGSKRKSYSNLEMLIMLMNDRQTRQEAVSKLKGSSEKLQKIVAVAEENFAAKKKARRLAKYQEEKGLPVTPVNDSDFPMFEGEAFRFVKQMLRDVA